MPQRTARAHRAHRAHRALRQTRHLPVKCTPFSDRYRRSKSTGLQSHRARAPRAPRARHPQCGGRRTLSQTDSHSPAPAGGSLNSNCTTNTQHGNTRQHPKTNSASGIGWVMQMKTETALPAEHEMAVRGPRRLYTRPGGLTSAFTRSPGPLKQGSMRPSVVVTVRSCGAPAIASQSRDAILSPEPCPVTLSPGGMGNGPHIVTSVGGFQNTARNPSLIRGCDTRPSFLMPNTPFLAPFLKKGVAQPLFGSANQRCSECPSPQTPLPPSGVTSDD